MGLLFKMRSISSFYLFWGTVQTWIYKWTNNSTDLWFLVLQHMFDNMNLKMKDRAFKMQKNYSFGCALSLDTQSCILAARAVEGVCFIFSWTEQINNWTLCTLYTKILFIIKVIKYQFWLQFPQKNNQKHVDLRFHSSKVEFVHSFWRKRLLEKIISTFSDLWHNRAASWGHRSCYHACM